MVRSDQAVQVVAMAVRKTRGEFQSGQMGQTVNLVAQPSQVRILLPPSIVDAFGEEFCGEGSSAVKR